MESCNKKVGVVDVVDVEIVDVEIVDVEFVTYYKLSQFLYFYYFCIFLLLFLYIFIIIVFFSSVVYYFESVTNVHQLVSQLSLSPVADTQTLSNR